MTYDEKTLNPFIDNEGEEEAVTFDEDPGEEGGEDDDSEEEEISDADL